MYNNCTNGNNGSDIKPVEKKSAREGFSWWTCMQLGLSLSESNPQPVPAKSNSES